jgi:hypothetical protein
MTAMKINHRLRNFTYAALILVGLFGLSRIYFRLTDDFRLANITYEMPYKSSWEVPAMTPEEKHHFDEILNQKFSYIGKGAQSYAFGSEDGKYVIKFFKFKHLKPSLFVDLMPSIGPLKEYKNKQINRKTRLLNSVFDGYRLAYAVHKDETGLIYIHLNKEACNKSVTLVDKIGLERTVNLDDYPFILQEKVRTTRAVMTELMGQKELPKVKERIGQIFDLYLAEYNKGIYDRDHGVMHNIGFAGDKPIHLDVGKLTKEDSMKSKANAKQDFLFVVRRLNDWFKDNYPADYPEMKAYIDHQINTSF